jgi:hypothetical protein
MKKAAYNILPGTEEILKTMGKQLQDLNLLTRKSKTESGLLQIISLYRNPYRLTRRQIEEMRPAFSAYYE